MLSDAGEPPLDADALLAPLEPFPALLLAVSGGPDSTALMLLAARWRRRAQHEILVATVDHGLRAEARAEAKQVAVHARALGFAHRLLVWEGEKPKSRVQERARAARYGLLAAAAQERTPPAAIVVAHHAEDQAETILFRLTRGSGVAGLAGMAPASAVNGAALLRPLLGVSKAALIATCDAAGCAFIRDPSNENPAYARVRLRGLASTLTQQGLDAPALLRLGARAAAAEEALAFGAGQLRAAALQQRDDDGAQFSARMLLDAPVELLRRVFAAEILHYGEPQSLRLDALERATQRVRDALAQERPLRLTLGGASIACRDAIVTVSLAPARRREG
jgi:tRNA(Ile)-lysidine synthase